MSDALAAAAFDALISEPPRSVHMSVVVPSYRRPADLRRCLLALEQQTLDPTEVVVVCRRDDRATRAELERWRDRGRIRVVLVDSVGSIAAYNAGLDAALGDIVAITDDDAMPHADWLERLAARFETDSSLGAVGGRDIVLPENGISDGYQERVGRVQWFGREIGAHHLRTELQEVQWLKGVNMAFRREAVGRYDPKLKGHAAQGRSDFDLCLAAHRSGWRLLFDPEILVDHAATPRPEGDARIMDGSLGRIYEESHNFAYVLLKWLPWWRKPVTYAYCLLVGSRLAPGPVLLVEQFVRGRGSALLARGCVAATRGRLDAVRTFAGWLADEHLTRRRERR